MMRQGGGATGNSNRHIGRYELQYTLGEGGFAKVYLGKHIILGTEAAVKILRNPLDTEHSEQFRHEAKTIANLIHPNIIRVLHFDVENKTPYLVMDYAPHGSLRQQVPVGSTLPLDTVVSLIRQVALALQYAHDKNVIHRDIKPENILIGPNGEILLSDFGIAINTQNEEMQTTHKAAGTVHYAAPEQINGQPCKESDQYALAIVVYELLTGTTPFQGTQKEIMYHHIYDTPTSLCQVAPHIPSTVGNVVMRALSKNPLRRYPSISAFAVALKNASKQYSSVKSRTSNSTHQRTQLKTKHFLTNIIIFLIVICLVVFSSIASVVFLTYPVAVTIVPKSILLRQTYTFFTVSGKPDTFQGQVYEKTISSSSAPYPMMVKATGVVHLPGVQAKGELTFFNGSGAEQTIIAGTHFTTNDGNVFVLDETITIAAANPPNSFGMTIATAHALNIGLGGNIPPLSIDLPCCTNDKAITVKNFAAFSGGQDPQTYTIVSKSDIDEAAQSLENQASTNAHMSLQQKVRKNEALSPITPHCSPEVLSNPKVNVRAKTVTVTVIVTCSSIVYDRDGALLLAKKLLKAQAAKNLGANYSLIDTIKAVIARVMVSNAKRGIIILILNAEGIWLFQLRTRLQGFKELIRGKSQPEVYRLLSKQEGIAKVGIQVPQWVPWFLKETLPTDINRIKLTLKCPVSKG